MSIERNSHPLWWLQSSKTENIKKVVMTPRYTFLPIHDFTLRHVSDTPTSLIGSNLSWRQTKKLLGASLGRLSQCNRFQSIAIRSMSRAFRSRTACDQTQSPQRLAFHQIKNGGGFCWYAYLPREDKECIFHKDYQNNQTIFTQEHVM